MSELSVAAVSMSMSGVLVSAVSCHARRHDHGAQVGVVRRVTSPAQLVMNSPQTGKVTIISDQKQ